LQQHLVRMFVAAGDALAADPKCAPKSTRACCRAAQRDRRTEERRVTFISDQVKSGTWAVDRADRNQHRRDLQYIPLHGSLIGGLAGLVLYTLEYLLRLV